MPGRQERRLGDALLRGGEIEVSVRTCITTRVAASVFVPFALHGSSADFSVTWS